MAANRSYQSVAVGSHRESTSAKGDNYNMMNNQVDCRIC